MNKPLPHELADEFHAQTGVSFAVINAGFGFMLAGLNLKVSIEDHCLATSQLQVDKRRRRKFKYEDYPHISDMVGAVVAYADENSANYSEFNFRFKSKKLKLYCA